MSGEGRSSGGGGGGGQNSRISPIARNAGCSAIRSNTPAIYMHVSRKAYGVATEKRRVFPETNETI